MVQPRVCRSAALVLAAAGAIPFLAQAQGGFSGPGRYEITNVRSGKVIDLDRATQTNVIQFSPRGTDNQQWDVTPAEGGYWFIRNAMNGAALEEIDHRNSTPVRGMPYSGSPAQQWRIAPAADGTALISNRLGKTLDIPNGETREGVRVNTYEINGNPNQRFRFRRLAELPPPPAAADDWDREHRWERYYGRFDERARLWGMEGDGVCFYREPGFRGRAFCVQAGEEVRRMPDEWIERFRSVKFFGRVRGAEVFEEEAFGGRHIRLEGDQTDLHGVRRVISVRVF
jgi:hypothetical protein